MGREACRGVEMRVEAWMEWRRKGGLGMGNGTGVVSGWMMGRGLRIKMLEEIA